VRTFAEIHIIPQCRPPVTAEGARLFRHCGIDCEDTEEVPSRPGLTQELTGFVPCQRFAVDVWRFLSNLLGFGLIPRGSARLPREAHR
jgi:hypothetical protein